MDSVEQFANVFINFCYELDIALTYSNIYFTSLILDRPDGEHEFLTATK
jgi:hypothetical protein